MPVRRVTWPQVGKVTVPGRYLFKFGWLTLTAADIAVWQRHPDASFALMVIPASGAAEEYHLGAFDLRDAADPA